MKRYAILLLGMAAAVAARTAPAAQSYCPNPAHAIPAKVPAKLVADVARVLLIDENAARSAAFVRCAGPQLLACYVGANLSCFKADTRRTLAGATAWCRDHPGSAFVPMFATGHATIYDWSCKNDQAVAGRILMPVDAQGYIAGNWRAVR
jgi:hypothetical protein